MNYRSQNKPPPRSPSNKNSSVDGTHHDKRRKIGTARLAGPVSTGRGRQPFAAVSNRQDANLNANDLAGTEASECESVQFTKEEVEALLNEKIKGKKFDLKGKMEQMNDHIKKLKLCIKWFQEVEERHVQEKEKLQNTLDSVERKCTATEVAMQNKEDELNSLIKELKDKTASLQENLTREELEKLASQDEAVQQKEILLKEVGSLRGELQQVRDDRDRQFAQTQALNAEIVKYKESTGKSVAELDNLTLKSSALEWLGIYPSSLHRHLM